MTTDSLKPAKKFTLELPTKDLGLHLDTSEPPTISFECDGWEMYRVRETGLTFGANYGERDSRTQDEHRVDSSHLLSRLFIGDVITPEWSNEEGYRFLRELVDGLTYEVMLDRKAKIMRAVANCGDLAILAAMWQLLGLE